VVRGSDDGELCTEIVSQQPSVEMAHLREDADLRQEYAAPGVFLGPGPMSTYCITDKQDQEYGRSGYWYIHSPNLP
jgi:hypothetical protein